jgi:hypothetical protein
MQFPRLRYAWVSAIASRPREANRPTGRERNRRRPKIGTAPLARSHTLGYTYIGSRSTVCMMCSRLLIAIVSVAVICAEPSIAANISSTKNKDNREVIKLEGEIVEGDTDKLVEIIRDVNQVGRLVSGIRLNSIGGNLLEGAKIADAIRTARIVTVVTSGSTCASACFLAFAAGSEKYAAYSARVGVHGASDAAGNETTGSDAATVAMARAVKALGVPAPIIGKMVVTPPSEIVWLSIDDLRSMGTTMVGKPNQTTEATTAPPNQIAPPIANAPSVRAEAPTWQTITDKAAAISTQQNNGKLDLRRTCQAELKVCTLAIWYRNNDGKAEMVRSTQDPDERVLERDICSFNEFMDVRTCVNFDTHVVTKQMLDANKSWTIIETSQ